MLFRMKSWSVCMVLCLAPLSAAAKAPPGRYQVNEAAKTVYDTMTKLTWQRDGTASGTKAWAAAGTYCSTLVTDGAGWRLPTIVELRSIVDLSQMTPAIDPTAFPSTPTDTWTWSSTKVQGLSSSAWYVFFSDGLSSSNVITYSNRVRCVR
jgi:hypothetical protein